MGELALRTIVGHLRGQQAPSLIDTGSRVVSKADLDLPEVKDLLYPDLKKWLKE